MTATVPVGVDDFLLRCRFPDPAAGPVWLAVSGGPDSMALMVLARVAGLEGTAVHVDHGLRPGSDREAGIVATVAAALGFDFDSRRVDVRAGTDLEARARRARYEALPDGVLTGHTMDDQAETVLLNVLRGAALDGLSAMRQRPDRLRPLLGLRRYETEEVCRRAGIDPLRDPSNADPRFRRNRLRSEALPLLCDVAGRDLVPVLARQAALAAEDVDLLETMASNIDPCDVSALRDVPAPLARRALRRWLRSAPPGGGDDLHPPSAAELARVMDVVEGRYTACELSGGRRVSRRAGRLALTPAPKGTL